MKPIKLKNWSVSYSNPDAYSAPELMGVVLCGNVYGHTRFLDGVYVKTSPVIKLEGKVFFTKSGSQYILEDVDPEYEQAYPNAKERIFKSLKEESSWKNKTSRISKSE